MIKKEYKGYVDKIQGGHLLGWAWNPGNPGERLEVELFQNGEVHATTRAEEFREDLKMAAVGDGMYGFRLPLTTKMMGNGDHSGSLMIRVSKNGTELPLSEECRGQLEKFSTEDSSLSLLPGHSLSKGIGKIEQVEGNMITGWLVGGTPPSAPLVIVDGKPARVSNWPIPRDDVSEALEVDHAYGFEAHVPFECRDAKVSLYCVRESGKILVDERESFSTKETIFLQQLNTAREIASQKGAIGICCWDGAHNPIGRAKVLYDVAATERPVILFSFLFDEFGGRLWKPLEDASFHYLGIPWNRRHTFGSFLKESGITFDTLWLCKPRFPTFELASYFAHPKTRLILDMDDNEEHFASSPAAIQKPYGMPGIGMARNLAQKISAKTVASISLQEEFGGEIVRHTREPAPAELTLLQEKDNKRIGFVGTVRAHKNLAQAARAIRLFGMKTMGKLEFHVYGDVAPEKHKKELENLGVDVRGIIPQQELQVHLAELDVLLTGYPTQSEEHEEINRYQISSKIGDALSVGKPVLVPDSPSVKDLADIPGVYLFTENNFEEALYKALTEKKDIRLPLEFTYSGAFNALIKAEQVAESSPLAKECFNEFTRIEEPAPEALTQTLLLVWKQNDAGVYGRRIDQIARLYRRTHPKHRVVILELLHGNVENGLKQNASNYLADASIQVEFSKLKAEGRHEDSDGVHFKQVRFETSDVLEDRVIQFLQVNKILPQNTTIVLFPYIRFLGKFLDFIRPYTTVVDMVDNQLMWSKDKQFQAEALNQFTELFYHADRVLFNSDRNLDYFSRYFSNHSEAGLERKCAVIPNWYLPPIGFQPDSQDQSSGEQKNIVYSGNMSDRIDWDLLKATALSPQNVTLHLIGAASRSVKELSELLELPNVVFHGALSEMDTLHRLLQMDLAVIPHKTDKVSTYMNPLKVGMFRYLGLPIVAMDVPGISASEDLTLCSTRNEFIQKAIEILNASDPTTPKLLSTTNDASGKQYIELLSSL